MASILGIAWKISTRREDLKSSWFSSAMKSSFATLDSLDTFFLSDQFGRSNLSKIYTDLELDNHLVKRRHIISTGLRATWNEEEQNEITTC